MKRKPKKQVNKQLNLSKILSTDLKWLSPYLEHVQDLVPFEKIKKIDYYQTRSHQKNKHHLAITHMLANNKTYLIYIRTTRVKEDRIPVDIDTQEDILMLLAHELAHVCPNGWEHGPKHIKIMADIFQRFGEVILRIDSEEIRNKKS